LSPIAKLRKSLGAAIASRMRPREGKFLWQTATGSVENLPREAALQILPDTLRTHTAQKEDWAAPTMTEVAMLIGPIIAKCTSYCAGATKALLTDSERVVRVVATVIPTAKFWWRERQGIDHLYFEFQYVLADEDGELHAPKDGNRIEMALAPALETAIRERVLTDLLAMADAGAPLAPGFLRQLGRIEEAMIVETRLHHHQAQIAQDPATSGKKAQRKKKVQTWDVDTILQELPGSSTAEPTFLVQWEGYQPSWEVYRKAGTPGGPVQTWEPLSGIQDTQAYVDWLEAHE
jgi:hypothetical protein